MTYRQKLTDPRWQKKRLRIFERDSWTCVSCDREDLPLHVHHIDYTKGLNPWDYPDNNLITYCEVCHNTEHLIGTQISESLIDIIKANKLLVKPVSELCILCEKFDGFRPAMKKFLKGQMKEYLKSKEVQSVPVN